MYIFRRTNVDEDDAGTYQDIRSDVDSVSGEPGTVLPKKSDKAVLARVWGNFDKR